jgi:hypothetical protein
LLKKEGVPFTRPTDYFAEMVKSDEHMGIIKKKMMDEAASKKAAAEARKQRDLRKFGKQVQVAKLQERDKAKRDTMEKIQILKRSMNSHLNNIYYIPGKLTLQPFLQSDEARTLARRTKKTSLT